MKDLSFKPIIGHATAVYNKVWTLFEYMFYTFTNKPSIFKHLSVYDRLLKKSLHLLAWAFVPSS